VFVVLAIRRRSGGGGCLTGGEQQDPNSMRGSCSLFIYLRQ